MIFKSIPSKLFVKRLGIELSDIARTARLSLRDGKVWEVEVTKNDKYIWFDKGWSDFVEDNSICHRYLLSFDYKGNSNFHVIIFDPSTFEINYPNSDFENENEKVGRENHDPERDDFRKRTKLDQARGKMTMTEMRCACKECKMSDYRS
ncbi:B3 domain-containing transcription factor VRN1-like [Jatropha curcas]|uniref:B3 domain-containing transcription factor VRN1-like n=1 Tax=Jatropha curcas TaxID=180498 RepID=UPI0018945F78|nr:B3 domain-containing transcription factor VRN1-like [Jatropha curcas]